MDSCGRPALKDSAFSGDLSNTKINLINPKQSSIFSGVWNGVSYVTTDPSGRYGPERGLDAGKYTFFHTSEKNTEIPKAKDYIYM